MKKRIEEIVIKTIDKLPQEYKFKFLNVEEDNGAYIIRLISPQGIKCSIYIISGKIDKLSEIEFIGAIAHELAHNWCGDISEEYKDMHHVFVLKSLEEGLKEKGEFRRAKQIKNKYLKYFKSRRDIARLEGAWLEYQDLENKTDSFVKEKFGLREEVESMRKVNDSLELNFRFKLD